MEVDGREEEEDGGEAQQVEQAMLIVRKKLAEENEKWGQKFEEVIQRTFRVRNALQAMEADFNQHKTTLQHQKQDPDIADRLAATFKETEFLNRGLNQELEIEEAEVMEVARKKIQAAHPERMQDSEDGIVVMAQSTVLKCPYSQRTFVEPCKHRPCGHTIDRSSMEELFRLASRDGVNPTCPQPGCKQKLVRGSFVPDKVMVAMVSRNALRSSFEVLMSGERPSLVPL